MAGLIALIMNLYICKDGMLLYFFKNDQLPIQKGRWGVACVITKRLYLCSNNIIVVM
jgi:hypothetical protein